MFIQVADVNNNLMYLKYDNLIAFNETTETIYLSSGASFVLFKGEVTRILRNIIKSGTVAGLGSNASTTQHYPHRQQ